MLRYFGIRLIVSPNHDFMKKTLKINRIFCSFLPMVQTGPRR
nr:MAG TPA: hypothetical protein [Caudoviricetes sp.]